jgi:hypothetical protein
MKGYVLSLCDYTGTMVRPWAEAGYVCYCHDLQHDAKQTRIEMVGDGMIIYCHNDVKDLEVLTRSDWEMIFAFPPCTHLAVSGARWFKAKGMDALIEALQVVNACRKIAEGSGAPYMIENPVSTLSTYWREPDHHFDPCDYAGYLPDPSTDAYTKRTNLWTGGGFVMPEKRPVEPVLGSKMHKMAPGPDRANKRSATPAGFAQAVFEANSTA